jgi:hypothetical protein
MMMIKLLALSTTRRLSPCRVQRPTNANKYFVSDKQQTSSTLTVRLNVKMTTTVKLTSKLTAKLTVLPRSRHASPWIHVPYC